MNTISKYFKNNSYLTAIIIIFGILFSIFVTSGSLFSGYHFTDDHVIVSHYYELQKRSFVEELLRMIEVGEFVGEGRFRPFFAFHLLVETKLFGLNLFLWSLYTGLIAVLTTFFLFVFGRLIQFSFKEALLFSFLSILGPQLDIGYRLLDNETMGMFWLSITLIYAVLSVKPGKYKFLYELLFIVFAFLMSISKESFIILIPAIAFIKVWRFRQVNQCSWYKSITSNVLSLFVLLSIFFLELLFIKYFIGTTNGYAGFTGFNFSRTLLAAKQLTDQGFRWVVLFSFTLIVLINRRNNFSSLFVKILSEPVFILFLLIVVPQILLYAKTGFFSRYLVPGILGYSILIIYLYKYINKSSRLLGNLLSFLIVFSLAFNFNEVWHTAHGYSVESKTTSALLNLVEKNTATNDPILIVSNPFVYYEWTKSVKTYLDHLKKRSNLYLVSYGSQRSDLLTNTLKTEESAWTSLNPEDNKSYYNYQFLDKMKDKKPIRCIIIPPKLKDDFLKTSSDWFQMRNFDEYVFNLSNPQDWFSIKVGELKGYIKALILPFNKTNMHSVWHSANYYVYINKT